MGIRQITGYIAYVLLGVYLLWTLSRSAPQLRRSSRDRDVRLRILLIKIATVLVIAVVVGVIHFWATQWWHVIVTLVAAIVIGIFLNRAYRRHVAVPRHRMPLLDRSARTGRKARHKSTPGKDQAGLGSNGTRDDAGADASRADRAAPGD
jgi:small-conductance mechanosensitive channel